MAFQPVPNTVHVALNGTLLLQQVQNNLYFLYDHDPNESDVTLLANNIAGWAVTELLPLLGNQYTLREVVATALNSAIDTQYTSTAGLPADGGVAVSPLPNNATIAISFRTGESGRSARGRNYVPGLTENVVDGNNLTALWAANISDAYNTIPSYVSGGGATWVVVQRWEGGVKLAAGVVRPVTNALFVDTTIDSQRRRLPGRGR